jgi:hypothetical protein
MGITLVVFTLKLKLFVSRTMSVMPVPFAGYRSSFNFSHYNLNNLFRGLRLICLCLVQDILVVLFFNLSYNVKN